MADLLIRDIDPADLAKLIADEVAEQLSEAIGMAQQPQLVDRLQMAKLIGIGTAKLDKLVSDGEIPSVLAGRRRTFEPSAVIEALKERQR